MDPRAPSNDGILDPFFISLVNDPRDVPFVKLTIGCALMAFAGIGLYFAGDWVFYLAPFYWAVWALVFLDRFILMLHCTSHRMLYKKKYKWMNQIIPWAIGPFFGETPETYFVHHMGMHHPENNLEGDLSSTIRYQRDKFTHWVRYFCRFFFGTVIELALYHYRKKNMKMFRRMLVGELGFWTAVTALMFVNWAATLVVFVIPVVMVRVLMMCGNWGQHAFVDASDPGNAYKNSITCINTRYNRRCFNDGYHIHHHVKARCHWSEYPAEFEDNKLTYGEQDAIVFEGIDFFQVWVYLMMRRYKKLATHFVQLPGAPERDSAEIVQFLRSRLQPIR
ncbi:MAG: fatty acid desaturase [Myxococcota bacterium]